MEQNFKEITGAVLKPLHLINLKLLIQTIKYKDYEESSNKGNI